VSAPALTGVGIDCSVRRVVSAVTGRRWSRRGRAGRGLRRTGSPRRPGRPCRLRPSRSRTT